MQPRTRLMMMIAIVIVVIIAVGRAHDTPPATGAGNTPSVGSPIGHATDDGKLSFDVTRIDCAVTRIGTPPVTVGPKKGYKFCVVSVTVADIGGNEVDYYDAYQHVFTKNGMSYSVDPGGAYFLKDDRDGSRLNPGTTIKTELPYEIPDSTSLTFLEFHEDAFSRGAIVRA